MDEPPQFTLKDKKQGSKKLALSPAQSNIFLISPLKNTTQAQKVNVGEAGGGQKQLFFCKNELLEGKGPSESLRGGIVSKPGRR